MTRTAVLGTGLLLLLASSSLLAEEPIDWQVVGKIRDEGLNHSEVMETLQHLTDDIGPRLTGSPQMREANDWTRDRLAAWGLVNAEVERWGRFGRGWSYSRASVQLLEPRATNVFGIPEAWTPGTSGSVRGDVVKVKLESESDLEEHQGELAGKVLLIAEDRELRDETEPALRRYDADRLAELEQYPIPGERRDRDAFIARYRKRYELRQKLNQYLVDEGVLAMLKMSGRDGGIIRVGGAGSREPGESVGVPSVVISAEQYRLLDRLLDDDQRVTVEVEVAARFYDDDLDSYNTVAELPGGDKRDELVMVGGHLDSWHPASGSNDNGAGVAVAMEAVRILKAIGAKPRRTIRIALWSGEEQGLLGSRGYVKEHFASRPEPEDPEARKMPRFLREETWPIDYKPAWSKLSAYFNLDNGSGKIRGVYTQSNAAVVPIFERWLEPFHDLGADAVTNRNTGGTDHQAFDAVGLPGFQFIQDALDYSTRTHHTNLDHFDHASADDLKQASVIMASFLYHAAMRDEMLPRKPKPRPPEPNETPAEHPTASGR